MPFTVKFAVKLESLNSAIKLRKNARRLKKWHNTTKNTLSLDENVTTEFTQVLIRRRQRALTPEAKAVITAVLNDPPTLLADGKAYYEGKRDEYVGSITDLRNTMMILRDEAAVNVEAPHTQEDINEYTSLVDEVNVIITEL